MKLTLDTNSLIYLFEHSATAPNRSKDALKGLLRRSLDGQLSIAATTRVRADLLQDKDEARRIGILQVLEDVPILPTIAGWDESSWNSDVWTTEQLAELVREVEAIVFPSLSLTDKRYHNKRQDIAHLVGHKLNKRDVFVTDDQAILKKSGALERGPGIIVRSPSECENYFEETDRAARSVSLLPTRLDVRFESKPFCATARFDYSNNDGRFTIGTGLHLFETSWSKGSDQEIRVYNDPPSIATVAKALGYAQISTIKDASIFDTSSRSRLISVGEIAIWRNTNGFYAATRVLSIADDTRNNSANADEVVFEYVILTSGADFRDSRN